jgi:hypothetical protein
MACLVIPPRVGDKISPKIFGCKWLNSKDRLTFAPPFEAGQANDTNGNNVEDK